jgi:hypothetical protein
MVGRGGSAQVGHRMPCGKLLILSRRYGHHRMPCGKLLLLSRRYGTSITWRRLHRSCALLLKVCHGSADTDTCQREPDGHDLEPLDPLVEAAESPSFVVFCTTGPPIADDSEAVHIQLQAWTQQLDRGRAQSGQRATVAPGETLSVSARTNKRHHHHH